MDSSLISFKWMGIGFSSIDKGNIKLLNNNVR